MVVVGTLVVEMLVEEEVGAMVAVPTLLKVIADDYKGHGVVKIDFY